MALSRGVTVIDPAARAAAYATWIAEGVAAKNGFVRGQCAEATRAMIAVFPELRRVGGFVYVAWGRDQHWWCVTPDGTVIDPTVAQFGAAGVFRYEELDIDDPATLRRLPTGVCMHCGEDVYANRTFCSDDCERATVAYLNQRDR